MAFDTIELKRKYTSPFRKEKDPSFEFFINNKSGRLWWHDWGTGLKGNCYDFLERYSGELKSKPLTIKDEKKIIKEKVITIREFKKFELDYWHKFGITKNILEIFNVFAVDSIDGYKQFSCFIHYLKNKRFRIYAPYSKIKMWKHWGTMKSSDVFGLEQLKYSNKDVLIITKSLKDVMALFALGYPAISFLSETTKPKPSLMNALILRYKKIFILYDNDKTGMKFADDLAIKYNIPNFYLEKCKDISDYIWALGQKEANKWIELTLKSL